MTWSEEYRLRGLEWVDKEAAAHMLEESKTTVLEQRKSALGRDLGDMPDAKATRIVKSTPEWKEYLDKMLEARKEANKAKVEMEYVRMKAWEQNNADATARAEMRLGGVTT